MKKYIESTVRARSGRGLLLCVVLATVLSSFLAPATSYAQGTEPVEVPAPTRQTSTPPVQAASGDPEPVGGGWVEDRIKDAVTALFKGINKGLLAMLPDTYLDEKMNEANFFTQTPPQASYNNTIVLEVLRTIRQVANIALALIVVVGGFNMIFGAAAGRGDHYATISEFLPRVILGFAMVNSAELWCKLLIDVNNALCRILDPRQAMLAVVKKGAEEGDDLVGVLLLLGLIVVFVLVILKMIMRLAVINVLIALSPLALVCWILPQTNGYARAWSQKFVQTVFGQFLFVVALSLAIRMHDVLSLDGASGAFQALLWVAMLAISLQAPSFLRNAEHHSGALGVAAIAGWRMMSNRARGSSFSRSSAARSAGGSAAASAAGATTGAATGATAAGGRTGKVIGTLFSTDGMADRLEATRQARAEGRMPSGGIAALREERAVSGWTLDGPSLPATFSSLPADAPAEGGFKADWSAAPSGPSSKRSGPARAVVMRPREVAERVAPAVEEPGNQLPASPGTQGTDVPVEGSPQADRIVVRPQERATGASPPESAPVTTREAALSGGGVSHYQYLKQSGTAVECRDAATDYERQAQELGRELHRLERTKGSGSAKYIRIERKMQEAEDRALEMRHMADVRDRDLGDEPPTATASSNGPRRPLDFGGREG